MARYNSAYTFRHPASRQDNHPWTGERDMDFRQPPFRNEKPMGNNFNYPPRNPASDYGNGYQHSRPVEYMSRSMYVRPNLRPDEHLPRNMHARRQEEYEDELAELNFLRKTELAELNFLRNNKPNITRWDKPDRDEEYQDPRPVAYRLGSIESKEAPICKFFSRTGKCRRFHSECKYLFLFTLTIVCQPLCFYRQLIIEHFSFFTPVGPFRHEKPNEDSDPNEPKNICYKYRETGDCPYGEECKFIHEEEDDQYEPKAICYQYRNTGDCPYGDECKFLHKEVDQNEAKAICYQYRDTGNCPYGNECKFLHEEVDQNVAKAICYQYRDTGDCPYGDECKFSHEEVDPDESTAICYQYRDTGECPYGEECKFKHVKKADETAKKICRFYAKTGSCERYKSECPFR